MKVELNVCLLILLQFMVSAQTNSTQPHIIIIVADDVGWNDFGLHGSNQIPTPNIDALGYNGVILDKFYTQQTCTPSRTALLTGKYPIRLGLQGTPIENGENRSLPFDTPTMAELLKGLGYSTHLVGKWHLGAACDEHTPTRRGFDSHFGYWNGVIGYFSYSQSAADPRNSSRNFTGFDLHDGLETQWGYKGQYATELFSQKSLEVIENHNASTPLFLMLTHLAGHAGENGTELGVPNKTRTDELYSYISSNERRSYADLINIMDQTVGDLVKKLSDKDMLENSIIIFFSDNGAPTQGEYQNFGSGWPFRGQKYTLFEGGVRGTGIVYSPLLKRKNYINNELIHITDFLPTLYRAAGGNLTNLGKIDGIDQWDVISNNTPTNRTEILLNIDELQGYSGILGSAGQYKLLNGTFTTGNSFYGEDGRGSENPAYDYDGIINSTTNVAIQNLSSTTEYVGVTLIQELRGAINISDCKDSSQIADINCHGMCLFDVLSDRCEVRNLINDTSLVDVVEELKARLGVFVSELVPETNRPVDPNSDPSNFNGTWNTWLVCNRTNISYIQPQKEDNDLLEFFEICENI